MVNGPPSLMVVNYSVVLQVRLEIVIYPDIQQNSISCLYQQLVNAPRGDKLSLYSAYRDELRKCLFHNTAQLYAAIINIALDE